MKSSLLSVEPSLPTRSGISSFVVVASTEQGQLSQGQQKLVLAQHEPQISTWPHVAVQTSGIHVALGGNIGYQPVPQAPTRHQVTCGGLQPAWTVSTSISFLLLIFSEYNNYSHSFLFYCTSTSISTLLLKEFSHDHVFVFCFCFVAWLAEFNQVFLCGHGCGAIHWNVDNWPVAIPLKKMTFPLQQPSTVNSSLGRGKVIWTSHPSMTVCWWIRSWQTLWRPPQLLHVHEWNSHPPQ